MPLLTVTNLTGGSIAIQDPTGLYGTSLDIVAHGTLSKEPLTLEAFSALEPQLIVLAASSHITWSVQEDPASAADSIPSTIQNVFVLKPGSTDPLAYTDLSAAGIAALSVAMQAVSGLKLLQVDDSLGLVTMPVGVFSFANVILTGVSPRNGSQRTLMTVPEGCQLP